MPSGAPRVSVVIDNYNYGRFLRQCLDSVLAQDFPEAEREIIVVDDGSTDDSRAIIDSYGERLRRVYQTNQGQASALNAGIAAARGELVCLLDADDWWAPSKLSRVAARFDAEPAAGLVQHWCEEVSDSGPVPAAPTPAPPLWRLDDFLAGRAFFAGTTGLSFRRSLLEKIGAIPKDLFYCADEFLYTHAIFEAPVATIPEILGCRRVHGSNLYAQVLADPRRLENHLKVGALLDELIDRRAARSGVRLCAAFVERRRRERAREELLLSRYRGRFGDALRSWRGCGGLFRKTSLSAALLSPWLYLRLQGAYARLRRLASR